MWAWIVRFLGGFTFWKPETLGKILWVMVIATATGLLLWKVFICKTISTNNKYGAGSQIYYNTYNQDCSSKVKDDAFSILKLWKFRLLSVR